MNTNILILLYKLSIKNSIKIMNNFDKVSTSEEFDKNLMNKISNVKHKTKRNSVFGFTPFYGAIFSALSIALFVTISQLFYNPNNNITKNVSRKKLILANAFHKSLKEDLHQFFFFHPQSNLNNWVKYLNLQLIC